MNVKVVGFAETAAASEDVTVNITVPAGANAKLIATVVTSPSSMFSVV